MGRDSVAARRRQYLALARRRARPGSGSTIEFLRARSWSGIPVELYDLHTPFVIVGGVATALYMPLRMTQDVDILVLTQDAPALYDELQRDGAVRLGDLSIGRTSWRLPNGSRLDVVASAAPWVGAAVHNPNTSPEGRPMIALPYLVLMKLEAGRVQDLADISRLLGLADEPALDQVREAVRRYLPDAGEDLDSLITLGKLETEPPQGKSGSRE